MSWWIEWNSIFIVIIIIIFIKSWEKKEHCHFCVMLRTNIERGGPMTLFIQLFFLFEYRIWCECISRVHIMYYLFMYI